MSQTSAGKDVKLLDILRVCVLVRAGGLCAQRSGTSQWAGRRAGLRKGTVGCSLELLARICRLKFRVLERLPRVSESARRAIPFVLSLAAKFLCSLLQGRGDGEEDAVTQATGAGVMCACALAQFKGLMHGFSHSRRCTSALTFSCGTQVHTILPIDVAVCGADPERGGLGALLHHTFGERCGTWSGWRWVAGPSS